MAVKRILTAPEPVLRQKSKPVGRIDKKIKTLIRDLKDTMKAAEEPKGVGLSASQIGALRQVTVIKRDDQIKPFINPKILSSSKKKLIDTLPKKKRLLEGCLSVPGIWGFVNRPAKVKVSYLTEEGKEKTEELKGREAVCIQHEIDHLNGILFVDRVLRQGGKLYKAEKDEEEGIVLVEIEIE